MGFERCGGPEISFKRFDVWAFLAAHTSEGGPNRVGPSAAETTDDDERQQ